MSTRRRFALTAATLLMLPAGLAYRSFAQHMETSTFNSAPARPKEDPKAVARGKQVYDKTCASCHGADLRGTDPAGHSLLRSQIALVDKHGEALLPTMLNGLPDDPTHKFPLSNDDANAVAAYIRSNLALIGSQGRAPGDASRSPDILVGNADKGKQYFAAKCANCHSVEGDLKGFSKKLPNPKMLQSAWIRGNHLGVPLPKVTVAVTTPGKPVAEGTLIHIDDFMVTLQLPDNQMQTFRRNGAQPGVVVHDPLEAHRNLLPVYTDSDIHDVTAYLVTLK